MIKTIDNQEFYDKLNEFAQQIHLGIKRKQVVLGRDKLWRLSKLQGVGLVLATEDLSKRSMGKLKLECQNFKIPLIVFGQSHKIGEFTGEASVKVYIFKKSYSGLSHLLREFQKLSDEGR